MNEWLYGHLACPRDKTPLVREDQILICTENHSYNIVEGVPILMFDDGSPTHGYIRKTLDQSRGSKPGQAWMKCFAGMGLLMVRSINSCRLRFLILAEIFTSSVQNKLTRYPFPELRLPDGNGKRLLDLGLQLGPMDGRCTAKRLFVCRLDLSLEAILVPAELLGSRVLNPTLWWRTLVIYRLRRRV